MTDPNEINKYLYIEKTPTWKIRTLYAFGIFTWLLVVLGFTGAILVDPFYRWFVAPLIVFLSVYHIASFGLNLFYKQFDVKSHTALREKFWDTNNEPSIDIFLPICGEDISILDNTWKNVSRLNYKNKKVYVLDDSPVNCDGHRGLAEKYGFTYFERPDKGKMKKAGNLKYGYERTFGEYIIIFDADFAPRVDFIRELLPYMGDKNTGIVQSPQYFEATSEMHKRSPLEYGAAFAEEPFYRYVQVVRSKVGATICCGSNAIYRRAALDEIGGPVQVPHSEDARTGFALMCRDWKVKYVPIILAVGLCPSNIHSYFHQQHRWCTGTMGLMFSKVFWLSPLKLRAKFSYTTGFMFYLHHPLVILFSYQLFWALYFYNDYISIKNAALFYPHILFSIIYLFFFPITRLRRGYFLSLMAQTYAYSHAIFATLFKTSVGWITTNAKQPKISSTFRHGMYAVGLYLGIYGFLLIIAALGGLLHPLNYNYYTVQFWIFYNMATSIFLFLQMRKFYRLAKRDKDSFNLDL